MPMKQYKDYNDLKDRLLSISDGLHKGLLCLTYASLGRVGEVVRHYKDGLHTIKHINPPISAEDISRFTTEKGRDVIRIKVLTEKVRQIRVVPVFPDTEYWLIKPFWNRKQEIRHGFMYDYSVRWAEGVYKKYFGDYHIHNLRHWRITHLLNGSVYGKPTHPHIVARMSGHKSLNTQAVYDHSIIEDYIDYLGGE